MKDVTHAIIIPFKTMFSLPTLTGGMKVFLHGVPLKFCYNFKFMKVENYKFLKSKQKLLIGCLTCQKWKNERSMQDFWLTFMHRSCSKNYSRLWHCFDLGFWIQRFQDPIKKSQKLKVIVDENDINKSCWKWSKLMFQIFFILPKSQKWVS